MQLIVAVEFVYVPAGHERHDTDFLFSAYFPFSQDSQYSEPASAA